MSDTTVHNNLLEKISNPKDLKKLKLMNYQRFVMR